MRPAAAAGLALCTALLGGCQMLDSQWLDTDPTHSGSTCHSNAGTYHLPRRLITVTITASGDPKVKGHGITVDKSSKTGAPYVADRNETYCLDFLLSYLSADRVAIQRDPDGLLERIFTQADDKTRTIAQDSIQAAADLIASERAGSLARTSLIRVFNEKGDPITAVAQFQFDPFVEREAREVNYALREFGYCVFIDPSNDPFVPPWSQEICREITGGGPRKARPERPHHAPPTVYKADPAFPRSGLPIFDPRPVPQEIQAQGVLYRPELSHSLVVMRKPDPGSRFSEWRRAASDKIVMPNAAPAFVLKMERAIFVKAEADVYFTKGLIKSVSINKPSELLVAADLAVAATQIITGIPAQTLKIFSNRAQNSIALINTNAELIQTLRDYRGDVNLSGIDLVPAAAQAQANTGLILGPNAAQARMAACLADPALQQRTDAAEVCRGVISRSP
jgi:hypothetical protein